MHYVFYPAADKRQDEIWRYSYEVWGEKQAEIYLRELHTHLANLAKNKKLWRKLPTHLMNETFIENDAYYSRYKHHIIFFRILSSKTIGIMSILHEAMDIPARLQDDLRLLDKEQP